MSTSPLVLAASHQPAPTASKAFDFTITKFANQKDNWDPLGVHPNHFIYNMVRRGHLVGPKDGSGIIAGTFKPGAHLEQKNLETVTGLILDVDGKFKKVGDTVPAGTTPSEDGKHYYEVVPPDWLLSKLPFCGVAHTSHSHTAELPKYRVILPLREPISPPEFSRLWFWVFEMTDRKVDPSCKNPDRMFFLPRCTQEAMDAGLPWTRPMFGPLLSMSMVPDDFEIPAEFRYELTRPAKKQGAHPSLVTSRYPSTDAHKLLECLLDLPIYAWAVEDAEMVSREVWRGLATNIAAAVLEDEPAHAAGAKAFHELSECDDARYNYGVAEKAFRDALKSAQSPGPMTYKAMKLNGAPEDLDEGNAKAPITHARRMLAERERSLRPQHLALVGAPVPAVPDDDGAAPVGAPDAGEVDALDFTYQQKDVLLDVHRNAYILKEADLFTGEIEWSLNKPIREEALNKMLISMGCPLRSLQPWKSWIKFFHFRRCIYTTNQLLVTMGPSVIFNTYKPTRLVPTSGNWDSIRALFLHIVGNDPDALEYFLDWCAAPLQKICKQESPRDGHYKNGTAVVLRGDPGAGKGTAMEILMLCYGMSNCVTLGQEDLDGKFHSNLIDKLFVVGNEILSSSNRSAQTANKLGCDSHAAL